MHESARVTLNKRLVAATHRYHKFLFVIIEFNLFTSVQSLVSAVYFVRARIPLRRPSGSQRGETKAQLIVRFQMARFHSYTELLFKVSCRCIRKTQENHIIIHRHNSLSMIAPHLWNDLPVHLRATSTLHVLSVTSRPVFFFFNYYGRSCLASACCVSTSRCNFMRLMTVIFLVLGGHLAHCSSYSHYTLRLRVTFYYFVVKSFLL